MNQTPVEMMECATLVMVDMSAFVETVRATINLLGKLAMTKRVSIRVQYD